jgi:hypothetical protein
MGQDFMVPETDHPNAFLFQKMGSIQVCLDLLWREMAATIHFNAQSQLFAKEIQNIRTNRMLPAELHSNYLSITNMTP